MLLFFPGKRDLLFILIFEIIKELKRRSNCVAHHKKKKKKKKKSAQAFHVGRARDLVLKRNWNKSMVESVVVSGRA